MSLAVKAENISKHYRLGVMDRRMLFEEVQSKIARLLGRPDPNAAIGDKRSGGTGEHRSFWALRDVNFSIKTGDSVGVLGRNGAGKSTLLKILSQVTTPTGGLVRMNGRAASLLEVGTGFHNELTGRENVYLNGAILGMSRNDIRARFDAIVDFSGIGEFIDTPVKRYSSGMRVRLAFSVAAHLDPEILIVDEVLAVGDAAFQRKCLGSLNQASRDGRTVIFVSHNMVAIENLCRRGILLEDGKVVFDGSQKEAVDRYLEQASGRAGDLAHRTDRRGSGAVKIVGIDFRNACGETLSTVSSGDDMDVVLHYTKTTPEPFPNLSVFIAVKNHFEIGVFHQNNQFQGTSFGTLPESGSFVCRLRDLPLPAGRYRLNVGVKSQSRGGDLLDQLDDAIEFSVAGGDFFGSGFELPPQAGTCLVRGDWRLEK